MSRRSRPAPTAGPGTRNVALRGTDNRPPDVAIGPTAEILRRLELAVTRRLDGMLQGDYRGLVPGHGSELGETRQYRAGDDVRRIDWNVTARMQDPHVRETIADRELETWALVDLTASLGFGTADCEKRDLAVAAVAALGFLTQRTGNRMGAITLEGHGATTIPARTGRANMQALLHRVVTAAREPEPGSADLATGVRRQGATMQRRGLAVVVSDFLSAPGWELPLRGLATRHETLAIEIVDPRELELPDMGVIDFVDPESGAVFEVQSSDRHVRDRFAEAATEQRAAIAASIRRAGADHLVLRTDHDWLLDLVRFVAWRRERVDALARVRP
jgi:uncharacterized protein (DUF58 family)